MFDKHDINEKYATLRSMLSVAENDEETKDRTIAEIALDLLKDLHLKITKISEM